MSQSFIKKPDNGPHSALGGLGVLATEAAVPWLCSAEAEGDARCAGQCHECAWASGADKEAARGVPEGVKR
jgi:hypothetical protein